MGLGRVWDGVRVGLGLGAWGGFQVLCVRVGLKWIEGGVRVGKADLRRTFMDTPLSATSVHFRKANAALAVQATVDQVECGPLVRKGPPWPGQRPLQFALPTCPPQARTGSSFKNTFCKCACSKHHLFQLSIGATFFTFTRLSLQLGAMPNRFDPN